MKMEITAAFAAAALAICGCTKKIHATAEEPLMVDVPVEFKDTKSAFEASQSKVGDVTVAVYDASGKLVRNSGENGPLTSCWVDNWEKIKSLTLQKGKEYEVFFLANCGDMLDDFPEDADSVGEVCYGISDYSVMDEKGWPLSYRQRFVADEGVKLEIAFKRLVTRLRVKWDRSAMPAELLAGTHLKSITVRHAAAEVYPFAPGGSRATRVLAEGDRMTGDDISMMDMAYSRYIYVLTNMQGDDILPPGTHAEEKTLENILAAGCSDSRASLLTYIEMVCRVDTPEATYEDVVYRHYLGGDSPENYGHSFDIHPNASRTLTLALRTDSFGAPSWRIEPEDPVAEYDFAIDTDWVGLVKGYNKYNAFTITSNRRELLEGLEVRPVHREDPLLKYTLSPVATRGGGNYARTLTFTTTYPCSGDAGFDIKSFSTPDEPLCSRFAIGYAGSVRTREVAVYTWEKHPPIAFRYVPMGQYGHYLYVCTAPHAPVFDYTLSLSGQCLYKYMAFTYDWLGVRNGVEAVVLDRPVGVEQTCSGTVRFDGERIFYPEGYYFNDAAFASGFNMFGKLDELRRVSTVALGSYGMNPSVHSAWDLTVNYDCQALEAGAFYLWNRVGLTSKLRQYDSRYKMGWFSSDYLGMDHGSVYTSDCYGINGMEHVLDMYVLGSYRNWPESFDFNVYMGSTINFSVGAATPARVIPR